MRLGLACGGPKALLTDQHLLRTNLFFVTETSELRLAGLSTTSFSGFLSTCPNHLSPVSMIFISYLTFIFYVLITTIYIKCTQHFVMFATNINQTTDTLHLSPEQTFFVMSYVQLHRTFKYCLVASIRLIVPGTVVVQPEAVLESQPIYNGPEFRHNKKTNKVSCDLSNVICSACNKKINPNTPGSAKRHPVLKVLLCKVWTQTSIYFPIRGFVKKKSKITGSGWWVQVSPGKHNKCKIVPK